MMLYGIGTYGPLERQRTGESSASYHKVPPRFRNTLDEVPSAPVDAPASDSHYVVQKGDTLAEIVRRQLQAQGKPSDNVAVFDAVRVVASKNQLRNANRLSVGQVLDLGAMEGTSAPKNTPQANVVPTLPSIDVEVLPPLPSKSVSKGLVETRPLSDSQDSEAANETAGGGGGGRIQPVGPMAAFSAQRSVLISPGPQGGPSHPIGRDLLAELAPDAHYPLARATGRPDLGRLLDRLLAPKSSEANTEVLSPPAAAVPDIGDSPWERAVDAPVRLTSGFGLRKDPFTHHADYHEGLDLAAASGSDIHPVLPGTVTFSGWKSGYGRVVIVEHGGGIESVYGHTSKNLVAAGDAVSEKTVLGHVGSSGRATGPHLHLEVRQNGTPIDPIAYLSGPNAAPANTALAKND